MENSKIEWCDHTFNPWVGCTKVSPGCTNCYAEALNKRFGKDVWGSGKPRQRTSIANWRKPLAWNGQAACNCHIVAEHDEPLDGYGGVGHYDGNLPGGHAETCPQARRPRVFCASMADWLDPEVPIEWLADLLALIAKTPNLDWLMLTKRPEVWQERMRECALWGFDAWLNGTPPANVWIGTSVEDQRRADERIPALLSIPARVRFLSMEPLLGAVDLAFAAFNGADSFGAMPGIDWIIIGGESGPAARECSVGWIQAVVRECRDAGVPVFVKQLGSKPSCILSRGCWPDQGPSEPMPVVSCGGRWDVELRDPKGGDPSEWPQDLRVREFPA